MIGNQIVKEIKGRLEFLSSVGLDYLSLSRPSATLSGGEAQRIRLATQIGSSLMGVLYILDEPSIGLHQRDNAKLLNTLRHLRDIGNTLIVVEHDEDAMRAADYLVDIGPKAGFRNEQIVVAGTPEEVMNNDNSITGRYLSGKEKIEIPSNRRKGNGLFLDIKGAKENNLKNKEKIITLGVINLYLIIFSNLKLATCAQACTPFPVTISSSSMARMVWMVVSSRGKSWSCQRRCRACIRPKPQHL